MGWVIPVVGVTLLVVLSAGGLLTLAVVRELAKALVNRVRRVWNRDLPPYELRL